MTGYVDLHAHVLPSIDDGPASLAESIELLSAMARTGVTTVAATSHVSAPYPNSARTLATALERAAEAASAESLPITVVKGAEIEMGMAMSLPDDDLRELCISGTRWLLVETPHARHPAGLAELVGDLRTRGFEVLIAHPERNLNLQENPRILQEAVAAGAVAQITGASLRGALGRAIQNTGWRFLEDGLAHIVASDAHLSLIHI